MGLSLHWDFRSAGGMGASAAASLVRALRDHAVGLPFGEVSEVIEAWARPPAGGGPVGTGSDSGTAADSEEDLADRAWALSQGLLVRPDPTDDDPGRMVRVAPVHVVAFRVYVAGAEEAGFGLSRHAEVPEGGYIWSGGCGTQGAFRRGGAAAFLGAHRAVVAVLDKARSLGLRVEVRDDGGFWESRDPKVLLDRLAEWESLTTAIARGRRGGPKAVPLASDMRALIEARRRERPRLDKPPIEELEG